MNEVNKQQGKTVILRKLMTTLDRIVVDGVTDDDCRLVAALLRDYRGDGQTFVAPMVDDFFVTSAMTQRTLATVIQYLNNNVLFPDRLGIPAGTGTLLFALHEYQHRYHEADDPMLVDGLSTLESHARVCIEDALSNPGWSSVAEAMTRAYHEAESGRGRNMVYRLFEVRQALREWLPSCYGEIFING